MNKFFAVAAVGCAVAAVALAGGPTPRDDSANVRIISPMDGAVVSGPVQVVFGLSGMGVAPAGAEWDNTGHHHLLVNRAPYGDDAMDDLAGSIPADENHLHFGGGQTETTLDLGPGTHTLQLVLGDAFHVPHAEPVMSEVITITVQ